VTFAVWVMRCLEKEHFLRRLIGAIAVLLGVQIYLGINVIISDKSFWITNLHVINGLLILALSFVSVLIAWRRENHVSEQGVLPPSES